VSCGGRRHSGALFGSGCERPLERRDGALGAPDGLGVMPKRQHGAGMAGKLRHKSDLDALGLFGEETWGQARCDPRCVPYRRAGAAIRSPMT